MDLAIRFPTQGRIHLESRFLFSEPHEPNCRQFLERVFQAPEITQVTIRSQLGSSKIPRSGAGFLSPDSLAQGSRRPGDRVIEPRQAFLQRVSSPQTRELERVLRFQRSRAIKRSCDPQQRGIRLGNGTPGCDIHLGHTSPRRQGRDPLLPARHDRHAMGNQARAARTPTAQKPGHPPQGRVVSSDRARIDERARNRLFQDQSTDKYGSGPVRPKAVDQRPDH